MAEMPVKQLADSEVAALREQLARWQSRLPKLTAAMRKRSEAIAHLTSENRRLKKALQERIEAPVSTDASDVRISMLEGEVIDLKRALEREKAEVLGLEARNRMLYQTAEIAQRQLHRLSSKYASVLKELALSRSEARSLAPSGPGQLTSELTAIKGIGDKLAQQMHAAGISSIAQLAQLPADAWEDAEHPLHALRARAARDGWVQQAIELLGDTSQ